MPALYHHLLFWLYWTITLAWGLMLLKLLFTEKERGTRALAAMLLVPVALRLLLIK